jgi:hypothetical protein
MRDHTSVLGTITVPTVVFAGDSNIFERGVEQGRCVAERIPGATFVASGHHVPFYEDAERFNTELAKTFSGPHSRGPLGRVVNDHGSDEPQ